MIVNLRICGVGGQGVITTGMIVSEAGMVGGVNAVMSEIHGLAQRGGAVSVDIRFGDALGSMIPEGECDILVALEPMEAVRNASKLRGQGIALVGSERIPPISMGIKNRTYPDIKSIFKKDYPDIRLAFVDSDAIAKSTGNAKTSNTVMLGAALSTGVLPIGIPEVEAALSDRFSGPVLEANRKALLLGKDAVHFPSLRDAAVER